MSRAHLLEELRHHTYVMLRPSPVEGVGVFAVRDIPRGCRDMFGPPDPEGTWVELARAEVDALPAHARHLVETYCLFDEARYWVPARGFKLMDLACYLNHGDAPNVASLGDGACFEALRDIAAGEELLIDYGTIVHAP